MILRSTTKKSLWLLLSITAASGFTVVSAPAATSVTRSGITWTFDRDYPTGEFVNGDPWVVGPVKITSISPRSTTNSDGATIHGSMINPVINSSQGYDSRMKFNTYAAAKNVGRSFPLSLPAGTSLMSSESYTTKSSGDNPQLKTIAILTVLGSPAPAGSFRPPPVGTNKALSWNKSQLDYSKLRSLPVVASTPSLASVEALFERPWNEQGTTWVSRYIHAGENQPTYGREIGHTLAQGLLSLQLNYTNAQKEKLLIRLVQYGIDIYGSAREGATWPAGGGHNHARKMPLLLAGTVLGDADMLAYADAGKKLIFQEDRQTWYVTQSDVGRTLYTGDGRPRDEYIQSDVGIPEWGEKHHYSPEWDGRNWSSYYRTVAGSSTIGGVLTARIMGLEKAWNYPAIFDYYDRYWSIENDTAGGGANSIQSFVASMWKAYRSATPPDYNDDNVATPIWQNTAITPQQGTFTLAFDMIASASNIDGVTGLSSGQADGFEDLAAAVRFAPNGYIDARNGGAYQAAVALKYVGGVKHRVVMTVNVETKRYSVSVTPAGGATVKIADNWNFRTEQASVSSLAYVGFMSVSGAHSVLDIGVTSETTTPPPSSTPVTLFRVNAGGSSFTDGSGNKWAGDSGYNTGKTHSTNSAIEGTTNDKLFQTERYDVKDSTDLIYGFSVADGSYEVKLHFAEVYKNTSATGKRVFDIEIEDKLVVDNLDIYAKAGGANRALTITTQATVSDGKLNIRFIHGVQNPKINGIEIIKQ